MKKQQKATSKPDNSKKLSKKKAGQYQSITGKPPIYVNNKITGR